jgi:hypothetical protein
MVRVHCYGARFESFQILSLGNEQQRTSVAARLAGAGVFDVAAAGKPDCYRNLICC